MDETVSHTLRKSLKGMGLQPDEEEPPGSTADALNNTAGKSKRKVVKRLHHDTSTSAATDGASAAADTAAAERSVRADAATDAAPKATSPLALDTAPAEATELRQSLSSAYFQRKVHASPTKIVSDSSASSFLE